MSNNKSAIQRVFMSARFLLDVLDATGDPSRFGVSGVDSATVPRTPMPLNDAAVVKPAAKPWKLFDEKGLFC